MRLAVTGGCGFIGSQVVRQAVAAGHEVVVLDRRASDDSRGGVAWRSGDVRDGEAVASAFSGADAVVHLAAKVGVEQGLDDLPDYVAHNDLGTAVVLSQAARLGVERIVLASSMVVSGEGVAWCGTHGEVRPAPRRPDDLAEGRFEPLCPRCGGPLEPALVGEDVAPDPRSGYAASKVAQEMLCGVWARQSGGSVAALRFHNVFGPGMPVDTPYAGVAAIFRSRVLRGLAPRVTEDGRQRRDLVHVRDVAAACVRAVESTVVPSGTTRAYNIGSGVVRTVLDLAREMARAAGVAEPEVTGAARLADVRHITADSARARAELRWQAREDFGSGVRELLGERPRR